jgi:hypothetical protein
MPDRESVHRRAAAAYAVRGYAGAPTPYDTKGIVP